MLSQKAVADSNLGKIYVDDVKCSHGSTVGQFNKEALFYLEIERHWRRKRRADTRFLLSMLQRKCYTMPSRRTHQSPD